METMHELLHREIRAFRRSSSPRKVLLQGVPRLPLWQKALLLLAFCMLINTALYAQGETIARLTAVKTWVNGVVNIIFIIAILYASIMCVLKFVKQEQGAWGYLFGVLIAFILWGGFTTYKNDIFAMMGGSNTIVVE